MPDPKPNFSAQLFTYIGYLEKVLLVLLVIGLCLNYVNQTGGMFVMAALIGLAGTCFLTAYKPPVVVAQAEGAPEQKAGFMSLFLDTIGPKVFSISCAISLVGIAFQLNGLKGSQEMLMIGGPVLGLMSLVLGLSIATGAKTSATIMPMLLRAVPVLAAVVYLLFGREV